MSLEAPPLDRSQTEWMVYFNERLKRMPIDEGQIGKKRCVYKVPAHVTDLNRKAYQPQVVSFGPYHHGEDPLRPMEEHKDRALHFVKQSGKFLEPFLESLREVVRDLEDSYEALDPKWKESGCKGGASRFLELMIKDGSFMLEILRTATQEVEGYTDNDPIFSNHGKLYIMPYIRRDMLMLENQLPKLVLDRLVAVESNGEKDGEFVNGLILRFCSPGTPIKGMGKCLHVLDVLRNSMLSVPKKKDKAESKVSKWIIPSATELHEHGISFEKANTNSLKDISFAGGVLKLPVIVVDEDTECMFLNLMAFERSHVGTGKEVTSYIIFRDNIIDNGQDVALLHNRGIINNAMGSDEAAAKLFNSLATGMVLDPDSSLHKVINKVRDYCKKKRHKWRAYLTHNYFRSPWVAPSLMATVLLFVLTLLQTAYDALSHYK